MEHPGIRSVGAAMEVKMIGRNRVIRLDRRHSVLLLAFFTATATLGAVFTFAAQATAPHGAWEVPRTPEGHPDLQGNWTNVPLKWLERDEGPGPAFTWIDIVNFTERRPPLTPEGERRVEELREFKGQFGQYDHPELRPLAERCLISIGFIGTSAGPPMIPNRDYNNNYTIVQNADHVMILAEMVHDVRIIRLGEPKPLPRDIRPWFGDSWGRWEGNTLVVETTNIHPAQIFLRIPPSEDLKVIERFTRVSEETILYDFTIDDPTTYTKPWRGEIPFNKVDDRLFEYACHEGNYRILSGVLSGARYKERTN